MEIRRLPNTSLPFLSVFLRLENLKISLLNFPLYNEEVLPICLIGYLLHLLLNFLEGRSLDSKVLGVLVLQLAEELHIFEFLAQVLKCKLNKVGLLSVLLYVLQLFPDV